ncbi:hypothetical protein BUY00_00135 [Staphylococcus chromogenes]|nr:hypothetical protein BUY01_07705 [Staphylococcus chromogenes]PTF73708.1 hypothetical protein BUY03_01725 [Staphylococcus chromogenes]PTF78978.1 hypothetical protein BU686_07170 [Staphylococcus chromogenes]PTG10400.1 hypothetical protein BU648_00415 [Staphylococcus chromogenes]PTG58932.1 hypothetical protein BU682_06880 [Staphylococcus chromogenes]
MCLTASFSVDPSRIGTKFNAEYCNCFDMITLPLNSLYQNKSVIHIDVLIILIFVKIPLFYRK